MKYSDTQTSKTQQAVLEELRELKRMRGVQQQQQDAGAKPTMAGSLLSGLERQSERMTHGVIDTYKGIRNMVKAPFSGKPYPGLRASQYGAERQSIAEYEQQAEANMARDYRENPISTMLGGAAYFAPMGAINTPGQALAAGAGSGLLDYGSTPAQDAISGMLGFKGGELVNKFLGNTFKQAPQTDAVGRAVKRGYQLTPAERSGSMGLEALEMSMESNPFTAGIMARPQLKNQELLNMQYLRELGLPEVRKGDPISSDAIDSARTGISKAYDKALSGKDIWADKEFLGDLMEVMNKDLELPIKSPDIKVMVEGVMEGFKDGSIDGKKYQRFRSSLNTLAKNVENSAANAQPGYAPAIREVMTSLDDLAARNLPDVDMKGINRKYRMMKQGTDGASPPVNVDTGNLSGSKMRNKLNKDGYGYKGGRDESPLFDTIHAMNSNPKSAGNSGTAQRMFLQNITEGDLLQNLLYGGLKTTAGFLYNSKANPIGRGISPSISKALKSTGTKTGMGTDVERLIDLLLGREEQRGRQ